MVDSKKKKRKINWPEYNESLVRRGEITFDTDFLENWRVELKKMNEGKEGRSQIPLSKFLDIAARHSTRVPSTIQTTGRISKSNFSTRRKAEGSGLHHDVVESTKSTSRTRPKDKPRKRRRHNNIAVDSTVSK